MVIVGGRLHDRRSQPQARQQRHTPGTIRRTHSSQSTVIQLNLTYAFCFTLSCLAFWGLKVVGLDAVICRSDEDCLVGQFCAKWDCDSLEGWMFSCSRCVACSTCRCDEDSLTGVCPANRCPGTPINGLKEVSGTFHSSVAVQEWKGDICFTVFAMHGKSFSQSSFRISRTSYDFVGDLFPILSHAANVSSTLCSWPDNKDHKLGLAQPSEAPTGFAGRLELTYHSGLPYGALRTVLLAHNCPEGLTAFFDPIPFISGPYEGEFLHYAYNLYGDIGAGYYLTSSQLEARIVADLHGPATGDPSIAKLSGHYGGTFTFGTTRLEPGAEGHFPGLRCNIDYIFAPSADGLISFTKHTYNCRLYTPLIEEPVITTSAAPEATPRPINATTEISTSTPAPARRQWKHEVFDFSAPWNLRSTPCPVGTSIDSRNRSNCLSCPVGQYSDATGQARCKSCTPWYSTTSTRSQRLEECCAPYALALHAKRGSFFVTASSLQALVFDCEAELDCGGQRAVAGGYPAQICSDVLAAIRPMASWFKLTIPENAKAVNNSYRLSIFAKTVTPDTLSIPLFRNRSRVLSGDVDISPQEVDRSGTMIVSLDSLAHQGVEISIARVVEDRYHAYSNAREGQERDFACAYADPACEAAYNARQAFMDEITGSEFLDFSSGSAGAVPLGLFVYVDMTFFEAGADAVMLEYESKDIGNLCARGTFSVSGSPAQGCQECSTGTFAPVWGHTACLECPTGTFANESAATRCHLCPVGTSTVSRGTSVGNSSFCLPFCPAGYFSSTGLAPCTPCPAGEISDSIGSRSCGPCPTGFSTFGTTERPPDALLPASSALGWSGTSTLSCLLNADIVFSIEQVALAGQKFFMTVAWKIPDSEASTGDIIAIMVGNGWDSYRQLDWSYTRYTHHVPYLHMRVPGCDACLTRLFGSAGGSAFDAPCSDQFDSGCKTQGSAPNPWGSRKFTIFSAGAVEYSAVFYSEKRQRRLFVATWGCIDFELRDDRNARVPCPPDTGDWIFDSGLQVCDRGTSSPNGVPPCSTCPVGFASSEYASRSCEICPRGTFATDQGSTTCTACPFASSTEFEGSTQCRSCFVLRFENPDTTAPGCNETFASGVTFEGQTFPGQTSVNTVKCSNRQLDFGEECDDGNTASGDGCSRTCSVEDLFACHRTSDFAADVCTFTCGNGRFEPASAERCDDGNLADFDGCSGLCTIEPGWACRSAVDGFSNSFCWILPICGNGVREWSVPDGEGCDDGNLLDGDGCSSACFVERHHTCINQTGGGFDQCCADLILCGDGKQQICEQCDDGNLIRYDGCSDVCRSEALSRCDSSCSGPACSKLSTGADTCPEHAVGKKRSDPNLDIWKFMGLDGTLPAEDDPSGRLGLSQSEVLFLHYLGGPEGAEAIGMSHIIGAIDHKQTSEVFRGLYSLERHSPTFLDCPHCHGSQAFHWPNGSISESGGALPTDRSCTFLLTSGGRFVSGLTRGLIVYVDFLDLHYNESLTIGDTIGSEFVELRRGSAFPLELHFVGNVEVHVELKSFLNDNRGWAQTEDGALRFVVRYFGLTLGSETFSCTSLCLGKSDCIKAQRCFQKDAKFIWAEDLQLGVPDDPFGRRDADVSWGRSRSAPADDADRSDVGAPMRKLTQVSPLVDELFVSLQGEAGEDQDMPCSVAQFEDSVLLEFERKATSLGADGVWEGRCAERQSCSEAIAQNNQKECIPDEDYLSPGRSCKVKWYVNHRYIREHRYDCGEAGSGNGVSEGVILDLNDGQMDVLRNPDTDASLFFYQRFRIAWTRTTSGRELGLSTAIYSYGNSATVQARGELQVLMNVPGAPLFPSPILERGFEEMRNAPGRCNRMTMKLQREPARLQAADAVLGDLDQLDDFFRYKECNDSVVALRQVALGSSDCTAMWDAYLARDALSNFTDPGLEEVCRNPCFDTFKTAALRTVETCRTAWTDVHFTENYIAYIFKKLVIVATAVFWMDVSCFRNIFNLPCIRAPLDFASVFNASACSALQIERFGVIPPFNFSEACDAGCIDAFVQYQREDDCCTDTVAEAQQGWAALLTHPTRTSFAIDLGETKNPWTNLGDGSNTVHFRVEQKTEACAKAPLDANCAMTSTCNSRNWQPKCCTILCRNGGSKKGAGSCYCACPVTNTGQTCLGRSAHVRATLLFSNENFLTFQYIHELWTLEGLAEGLSIDLSALERDSIDEVNGRRADGVNGSVTFSIRIITAAEREAQRLGVLLFEAFQLGNMQQTIHQQSGRPPPWTPQISLLGIPVSYSASGEQMCDGVLVKCAEEDRGLQDVVDTGLEDEGGGLSAGALGAIIGITTALCLGGCITYGMLIRYGVVKLSSGRKSKKKVTHIFTVPDWVRNRDLDFAARYFRRNKAKDEPRPMVFRGDPFKSVRPFSRAAPAGGRRKNWNEVFENTRQVPKTESLSSFVAGGSLITNLQHVDRDKAIKVSRNASDVVVDSALVADLGSEGYSHVHVPIRGERDALMSKLYEHGPPAPTPKLRLPATTEGKVRLNAEHIDHAMVTSRQEQRKIDRTIQALVQLDRGVYDHGLLHTPHYDEGLLHTTLPAPTMLTPRDNTFVATDPLRQGQQSRADAPGASQSVREEPRISALAHDPAQSPRPPPNPHVSRELELKYPLGPPSSTIIDDPS